MEPQRFYTKPGFEEPPKRYKRLIIAANIVVFIAICWALTLTVGTWAFHPEIQDLRRRYERGFQNAETSIRAPLPFILTIRIEGMTEREGVSAYREITRYYFWFFKIKKQIPEESAPFLFKWVWLL